MPSSCTSLHRILSHRPKVSFLSPHLLVTALSALLEPSTPRLLDSPGPPCCTAHHHLEPGLPQPAWCVLLCLSAGPPPHGIRHLLHVRVSPRRHLDIGQAWWEQPRRHPTSAVPSTGTAIGTSTRARTPLAGTDTGPRRVPPINVCFTNSLTCTHLARSQPVLNPAPRPPPGLALSPPPTLQNTRLLPLHNVSGRHCGTQHKYDATDAVPQAFRSCADRDYLQGAPQGRPGR